MDIFIANLHPSIEEDAITKLFEVFGEVTSTVLVRDRDTRLSKGYGFVKMESAIEAQRAIEDMNGRLVAGRNLVVKESLPNGSSGNSSSPAPSPRSSQPRERMERPRVSTQRSYDYDGGNRTENIPLEVQDESKFTKTVLDDGLIKIQFDN